MHYFSCPKCATIKEVRNSRMMADPKKTVVLCECDPRTVRCDYRGTAKPKPSLHEATVSIVSNPAEGVVVLDFSRDVRSFRISIVAAETIRAELAAAIERIREARAAEESRKARESPAAEAAAVAAGLVDP